MEEMNIEAFKDCGKKLQGITPETAETEPDNIADLLDSIPDDTALTVFRLLPKTLAVDVFDYMDGSLQNRLLECFSDRQRNFLEACRLMTHRTFRRVPAMSPAACCRYSPEQKRLTVHLLGYKEALPDAMTPYFVDLHSF